tara:strand:+ start:14646 stop:15374 length:729 start_codon:yes stop_codon:yes gene_type:complete
MAVPSSGTLNQKGLAQECLSGTYGSGSISGRICLDNLVNGGQCGSGSETYPTINTSSPSHPNTSVPYEFSEFYGYDKDATSSIERFRTPFTYPKKVFGCSQTCNASMFTSGAIAVGVNVYTNSGLSSPIANGNWGGAGTSSGASSTYVFTIVFGTGYLSSILLCSGPSDERLKKNIKQIGVSRKGVNIYEFEYKYADSHPQHFFGGKFQGVLGHEVPWAATENKHGFLEVDYSKVDVICKSI